MYLCVTARTSLEPRRTHLALSQITVTVIRLRVVFGAPHPSPRTMCTVHTSGR